MIIGEKKYRNGQYTLEAYKLLLETAFDRLNLENIKSSMANPVAKKLHELLGFKYVGSYKDLFLINDKKTPLNLFYMNKKMWKKNF